jgi:hypothetical protein
MQLRPIRTEKFRVAPLFPQFQISMIFHFSFLDRLKLLVSHDEDSAAMQCLFDQRRLV